MDAPTIATAISITSPYKAPANPSTPSPTVQAERSLRVVSGDSAATFLKYISQIIVNISLNCFFHAEPFLPRSALSFTVIPGVYNPSITRGAEDSPKAQPQKFMYNNMLPLLAARYFQDDDDDESPSNDHMWTAVPSRTPAATRNGGSRPQRGRAIESPRKVHSSTPAHQPVRAEYSTQGRCEHIDLTEAGDESGSDQDSQITHRTPAAQTLINKNITSVEAVEEPPHNDKQERPPAKATTAAAASANGGSELDNTPLPVEQEPEFLNQARSDYRVTRPPFVRLNKGEPLPSSKRVTLATADGRVPETVIPATLKTRAWDSKYSFYTLDYHGETLIVKPVGNRFQLQYRAWSGQGNRYQNVPVAFALKDDAEDQPRSGRGFGDEQESNVEEQSIHKRTDLEDEDYTPPPPEEPSPMIEAQQGPGLQKTTGEPDSPEPPTTRAPPSPLRSFLNASHDDGVIRSDIDLILAPRAEIPPLHPSPPKTSTAAPRVSEIAVQKRPPSDHPVDDRFQKRSRPSHTGNIVSTATVTRVPPTLTANKQERTILYVLLPGTVSDMVPIKLCSAMSITALFSSVCAAVGIEEYAHLAIAVLLERQNGGPDRSIILKQNVVESFEFFLETVDKAACWSEENGKLLLQLQLRFMVEVAMRV